MLPSAQTDKAAKIVKNSAAMFASAVIAKGGGLFITVLVARYLGASALGVFAVIQSLALLLENMIPLGQQDALIRTVARDRSGLFRYWLDASITSFLIAVGLGSGLVLAAVLKDWSADTTAALCVAAAGFPFAGLNLVAQAVLQGAERMGYLSLAAFAGRLIGLALLWLLLAKGSGIWAAFASRAIFQLVSLMILGGAVWLNARRSGYPLAWHPSAAACRTGLRIAFPFWMQRFLSEGLNSLNILILPMLVTLAAVGWFNAANQVTQISSMLISIVMLTVLPVFTRSFKEDRESSRLLSDQTLKFLFILIFPLVFLVTIAADKIILLLYGSGYEVAVKVLQVIIWSQIFIAADAVMKNIMIAGHSERAMVQRSAAGLAVNIALTIALGRLFGVFGIAAGVVMSSALLLALDVRFVSRHISKPNLAQVVGKPFICAGLAGIAAFAFYEQELIVLVSFTAVIYALLLFLFKAFSGEELFLFRQLCRRLLIRFTG